MTNTQKQKKREKRNLFSKIQFPRKVNWKKGGEKQEKKKGKEEKKKKKEEKKKKKEEKKGEKKRRENAEGQKRVTITRQAKRKWREKSERESQ